MRSSASATCRRFHARWASSERCWYWQPPQDPKGSHAGVARSGDVAHQLLDDIDKETVDFGPNYDDSETQPLVLPTRVPNLLVNGSSGIAVGMATNIPPHNLNEIVNACLAIIETPDISVAQLLNHVPGPDFPTAGIINGRLGIHQAVWMCWEAVVGGCV